MYMVPGHQQGSRWGKVEGGSFGMDLEKGVSSWGRIRKGEADKGIERESGAQEGYVPRLKSHSTVGSHK